jgi:hypothetical protein
MWATRLAGAAVTVPEGAVGQDVAAGGKGFVEVDVAVAGGEGAAVGLVGTLEQAVRKATIVKQPHFNTCRRMASCQVLIRGMA